MSKDFEIRFWWEDQHNVRYEVWIDGAKATYGGARKEYFFSTWASRPESVWREEIAKSKVAREAYHKHLRDLEAKGPGALLRPFGATAIGTGGGCTAILLPIAGRYALVTVEDDAHAPDDIDEPVYVGVYSDEDTSSEAMGDLPYRSVKELAAALGSGEAQEKVRTMKPWHEPAAPQ